MLLSYEIFLPIIFWMHDDDFALKQSVRTFLMRTLSFYYLPLKYTIRGQITFGA